jgi:two-component system response regulator PhoP
MRVLLVEDEVRLADNLAAALRDGPGLAVDWAADGEAGDDAARNLCYDLVILDLMLPKLDGYGVLRRMRARKDATPVLILTAKEGKDAIIQLLNAGADDYLAKPFEFAELLARLRALLRRARDIREPEITVADLIVDTRGQTARRGGTLLPLTTKEYALLEYLARNVGRVVGRADISAHVWDDNHDPGSNAIDVCVTRLRRKVDNGREPLIHTRRGAGYLLAQLDEE